MFEQFIGIDIGDWKTCVCTSSGKGYNLVSDGNNANNSHFFQPIVHYEKNGTNILVSSQATWSDNVHRVSRNQEYYTGDDYTSRCESMESMKYFLTGILNKCNNNLHVTITHPVEFNGDKVSHLRSIVESIQSVESVNLIPDPIAAAFCYLMDKQLSLRDFKGQYIVVDIGYASTRISLVECEKFSARVVSTELINGLSGKIISEMVIDRIVEDMRTKHKEIKDTNKLRREIERRGWGVHSLDSFASFFYEEDNKQIEIKWYLSDLDAYVKHFIKDRCFPVVDRLRNQNGSMILLVGGGSQLPSVRKVFEEQYPSFVYAKKDDAIASLAYGACRYRSCLLLL